MLQWAREQGCPWNVEHVHEAAFNSGNVEMMRWLDEQGVP
jgi:hypothetical protein